MSDFQGISAERSPLQEAAKNSLDFLAGLASPTVCTSPFPAPYKALWSMLTESSAKQRGFGRFAIGLPRGFAKTTLLKLLVLYTILYTDRQFILIVCRTARHAQNFMADVFDMLSEPNIQSVYGDWRASVEQNSQEQKQIAFRGRRLTVAAIGAEGSVRGFNVKNVRPDVVVMDDVQDWENASSPVLSRQLLTWLTGTLMKAASKIRCDFYFIGNMYPFEGSILRKLKNNPLWISFVVGGLLADGESLWPELQSKEQLLAEYENDIAMGTPEVFLAEVLNDETASGRSGIDISAIEPAPEDIFTEFADAKFIIIDPATSKKNSDSTEIGYFEVRNNVPCLMKLLSGHWVPGDMIRHALMLGMENNCKLICVESVGYQYTLLYWFEQVTKNMQITGFELLPLYPKISKNARIKEMASMLAAKKILLHREVFSKAITQLAQWNPLKRDNVDDILDVIAYAPTVLRDYSHLAATDLNDILQLALERKYVDELAPSF